MPKVIREKVIALNLESGKYSIMTLERDVYGMWTLFSHLDARTFWTFEEAALYASVCGYSVVGRIPDGKKFRNVGGGTSQFIYHSLWKLKPGLTTAEEML